MWALPTRVRVPNTPGLSPQMCRHPNCRAILEPPTKSPLEGSPSPTDNLVPARDRAVRPSGPGHRAGKMDVVGAWLCCPGRISRDLRGPFIGPESSQLPAYGGGQGKGISIRGGSLRSQANTDKLCNTSARRPESFILLRASQRGFARSPFAAPTALSPPFLAFERKGKQKEWPAAESLFSAGRVGRH